MALTMMRVIQHRIMRSLPEDAAKDLNWSYGLPGARLSKALLAWQIEQLSDEYYRMVNTDSQDLQTILNAFALQIPRKLFTRGDLRALKGSVSVF